MTNPVERAAERDTVSRLAILHVLTVLSVNGDAARRILGAMAEDELRQVERGAETVRQAALALLAPKVLGPRLESPPPMLVIPEVSVGDIVEVPPGVTQNLTIRVRFRVDEVLPHSVGGPRIKADGSPAMNRDREPLRAFVFTEELSRCIIHHAPKES